MTNHLPICPRNIVPAQPMPSQAEIEANIERDGAEWLAKQRAIFAKRWAEKFSLKSEVEA